MIVQIIKFCSIAKLTIAINLISLSLCNVQLKNNPNPGSIYIYNKYEIVEQKTESKWCHKYCNSNAWNPYHEYLKLITGKLATPASTNSKKEFDNLFDNRIAPRRWYTFSDLNQSLTNTWLSNFVKINLDWNKLFQQTSRVNPDFRIYDDFLLRFYNIIAKVYGVSTVLRLVQIINVEPSATVLAHTIYYLAVSGIKINFSKEIINQKMIENEFSRKHLATNIPIVFIIREYAHALFYYVTNTEKQRENFNSYPILNNEKNKSSIYQNNKYSSDVSNMENFRDVTQSLIDFIVIKSKIDLQNDPIKKLLLSFFVVNSRVSKKAWLDNNVKARDELFTEAFARWLGTSDLDRDFSWEILNEYFMSVFKRIYSI